MRFPEYFRELYARKTDLNVVLFYDVSDVDDTGRYDLIKGHLQTRAVENVSTIVSVDSIHPYQTAPTAVFGKSGQILKECTRNQPELLIYDFEKTEDDFGETGRRTISDTFFFRWKVNKNNDMKYRYGFCLVSIQRYLVSFFCFRRKGVRNKKENTPRTCRGAISRRGWGDCVCILPDSQHMLHEQAHGSDADPAAKAQGERFTAGFDEFYDVCI